MLKLLFSPNCAIICKIHFFSTNSVFDKSLTFFTPVDLRKVNKRTRKPLSNYDRSWWLRPYSSFVPYFTDDKPYRIHGNWIWESYVARQSAHKSFPSNARIFRGRRRELQKYFTRPTRRRRNIGQVVHILSLLWTITDRRTRFRGMCRIRWISSSGVTTAGTRRGNRRDRPAR